MRDRKLVQWALAYVAAAFALLQAFDLVAQRFGWPEAIERALIVAVAIGFFATLILAWYHGEKGTQRVSGTELLILALLLAIGGGVIWRVAQAPQESAAKAVASGDRRDAGVPAAKPLPAAPASDKSIAVLPFASLSEEKANAFFADGIQDEILTRLAKIGTLKVISRTSPLRYASHPDDLKEIARQLGVANILEGSVQKAADAVRVNVQLIRAEGDTHLWAETYDRKLDNVFGVESEVAKAIADALDAKLSGAEKAELAHKPTNNAEAWEAYLHGLALFDRVDIEMTGWVETGKAFEKAVRADPQFGDAWAALSVVDASQYFRDIDSSQARRDAARDALAQATRLNPDAYETLRAQAYYAYYVEHDYEGARTLFERMRVRAPSDAQVPRSLALIARRLGRWGESDKLLADALDLDPRNGKVLLWTTDNESAQRRFPAALRMLGRFTDLIPGDISALAREAVIHMSMGDLASADADVARMHEDRNLVVLALRTKLLLLQRRYADGIALWRAALPDLELGDRADGGFWLGEFLRLSGDAAAARPYYVAARDHFRSVNEQQPDNIGVLVALAFSEAALGDHEAAVSWARKAIAMLPTSKDAVRGPANEEVLARIQALFGESDVAIAALQRLLVTPHFGRQYELVLTPAILRLDRTFDKLRDDPRFRKLAEMPDGPTQAGRNP
jgi:TolB-like protein/Flp pilus assembly protein TadD